MNILIFFFGFIVILALAGFSGLIKVGTFNLVFISLIVIMILFSAIKKILNSDGVTLPSEQEEGKQEEKQQIKETTTQSIQGSPPSSEDKITWGQN